MIPPLPNNMPMTPLAKQYAHSAREPIARASFDHGAAGGNLQDYRRTRGHWASGLVPELRGTRQVRHNAKDLQLHNMQPTARGRHGLRRDACCRRSLLYAATQG